MVTRKATKRRKRTTTQTETTSTGTGGRARSRETADERREREGERYYGFYGSTYGDMTRDLHRLAYAFSRASVEAYMGTTRVVGDLLLNMAESYYHPGYRGESRRSDDFSVHASERTSRSGGRGSRETRRTEYRYSMEGPYSDMSNDLTHAMQGTADVLARSADEFARAYGDETERETGRDVRTSERDYDDDPAESRSQSNREASVNAEVEVKS